LSQSPQSSRRPRLATGLTAFLVFAGLGTTPVAALEPSAGPSSTEPEVGALGELVPSIHYEDAQAHATDVIEFEPGERVTVPFTPRATDRAEIGGAAPRALPAARASGQEMAATGQGEVWAEVDLPAADTPTVDPATVLDADPTAALPGGSWEAGALEPAAAAGLRREVFGFLPYWELSDSSTTLDYSVLSTIAYFGVGSDKNGNLLKRNADGSLTTGWSGWTSSRLTSIISAAHANRTRVVLTVQMFAWTSGQAANQAALLGSPTARLNLAKQAAAAVRDRGADGINLDFEPIASGYADEYTAFVRTVRTELDRLASGYQLTFDTTGYIGNYPVAEATAPGGADAIFVMGYDYRTASAGYAGSISPLAGPAYDLGDTLAAYLARVPASKLILGVPYYGRAWSTVSDAPNARTQTGEKFGGSSAVLYETALELATDNGRRYDTLEQAPWTAYRRETCTTTYGCVMTWRELYYDDAQSLKAKYDLVNARGLRGVGLWALGYDGTRTELYRALRQKFLEDTTAPVVGVVALPITNRDEGIRVHWDGRDDVEVASYDVQVSVDGGAWTGWLNGATGTTAAYPGRHGHRYAFRVRARDLKPNVSAWDVTTAGGTPSALAVGGFARVAVGALSMRAAAGTSATKLGELDSGDVIQLTGGPVSASGYTWYQATGPLAEWKPVAPTSVGFWVATGVSGEPYLTPRQPLNVTVVDALLRGLTLSAAGIGGRTFSPNGDGVGETLRLAWTNAVTVDSMTVRVRRTDGSLVGSIAITQRGAGPQTYDWDGKVGGTPVPDGSYVLSLEAVDGGATYGAPVVGPLPATIAPAYTAVVDRIVLTRLSGPDRYATAAAISAATFPSGAPVAYVATGLNYPDALAGAVAAARAGGPLLLVTPTALPNPTKAELGRLKPKRIVVLGAAGAVSDAVANAAKIAARGS
jgi:spore germination protein YaaH